MTELLPCPFCGSDDLRQVVHDLSDSDQEPFGYSISCNVCFVDLPPEPTQGGAFKTWNTRATQPVDVEKLKREVCDTVTYDIGKVGAKYASYVVSDIIDHLAASGYLRAPLPKIEGLAEAIDILEAHMQDMGDMAVVLIAARAYQKASG